MSAQQVRLSGSAGQACLLSYLLLLTRSWTFPTALITAKREERASGTDVLQECPGFAQIKALSSFLHWEGTYLTSLRSGGFSNRGSHAATAAPSIPQHPELIPTRLLGPPDPVLSPHFHPAGSGKKGLGSLSGNPGRHQSSLRVAPTFSRQAPCRGGVSQAREGAEPVCECWGISR